ncbi:MAG: glycosyltransferase family 2 protein [Chloroflexi bacterium]|nr:glycosyltransferase family 2 protein [Chloroflexota bacterium]
MVGTLFWLFVFLVVYTYIGYPFLIWLFARVARGPTTDSSAVPSITLLIAAFNEEKVIAQKIENSLKLVYPRDRFQILVMDDGSEDGTQEIIKSYADRGVELAFNPPRRGKMAAINRAIQQARGEVILFSDASNAYAPDVIQEIAAPFADPRVGAVVGARTIEAGEGGLGESEGLYWKYESFIQRNESLLGCCTGIVGEVFALRRDLFIPPPDGIINDDFFIAMQVAKQGYYVAYAPKARSFESLSLHAQDGIERRKRIVAGRYQAIMHANRLLPWNRPLVVWQIISHKFMRPLVPLFMIGALFFNLLALIFPVQGGLPLLTLTFPYNWIMFSLQIAFYLLAIGGRLFEKRNTGWLRIFYVPTFLFNSNLAALAGMVRFLSGRQTSLWAKTSKYDSTQKQKEGDS